MKDFYGIPTLMTDVGMIEQPSEALARSRIDYAKAMQTAEEDSAYNTMQGLSVGLGYLGNTLGSIGAAKASVGSKIPSSIGTSSGTQNATTDASWSPQHFTMPSTEDYLKQYSNPSHMNWITGKPLNHGIYDPFSHIKMKPLSMFAYGGEIGGMPVEVEGNEYIAPPGEEGYMIQGPSHEQGGIPINLQEGTKIFSDRIDKDGLSMAKRKAIRESNLKRLEKRHKANPYDRLTRDTYQRYKQFNEMEDQNDMDYQRQFSQNQNVFAGGGR